MRGKALRKGLEVSRGETEAMLASLLVVAAVRDGSLPDIQALLKSVDSRRLKATVEKLASFHTRNTLSPSLFEAAD